MTSITPPQPLTNGDDYKDSLKDILNDIRSEDEQDRAKAIIRIPSLILKSIEFKDELLNQFLLVIYNLNTDEDNYEAINSSNRVTVIRHLLRLYTETIQDHKKEQIDALVRLIDHSSYSPELLIELAYVLYNCSQSITSSGDRHGTESAKIKSINSQIDGALNVIKEKASENLYSDTLLMIYSIFALQSTQSKNKEKEEEMHKKHEEEKKEIVEEKTNREKEEGEVV